MHINSEECMEGQDIHNRLGICRVKLKEWNRNNGVNGRQKIDELQRKIGDIQQGVNRVYRREDELTLKRQLEEAWKKEEEY